MDNYANYLAATNAGNNNLMKCGASLCVDTTDLASGNHACDTIDLTMCVENCSSGGAKDDVFLSELYLVSQCMTDFRIQPDTTVCTSTGGGQFCSTGVQGSSRMDAAIAAIFDILDADDSIDDATCNDPDMLFDGVNNVISCGDYITTPFRDLLDTMDKNGQTLPLSAPFDVNNDGVLVSAPNLEQFLTALDTEALSIRFRTMVFSGDPQTGGGNAGDECTNSKHYDVPQGGFAGNSLQDFKNAVSFYASRQPAHRTGIAFALGFDDRHESSGGIIPKDAMGIYEGLYRTASNNGELCTGDFVILLTDGEDNCAGSCVDLNNDGDALDSGEECGTCTTGTTGEGCDDTLPGVTGNSNRRSTIQAVSNLRTHFTKPSIGTITGGGGGIFVNKEIMTFVIGWGVENNPQAVRTLNAAAFVGGTHTTGILKHTDPSGGTTGTVFLDGLDGILPDSARVTSFFPWVIELAEMSRDGENFSTNPDDFTIEDCGKDDVAENPDGFSEDCTLGTGPSGVHCHLNGGESSMFSDCFFDDSVSPPTNLFASTEDGSSFAFFVSNPDQLKDALGKIFEIVGGFTAVGVAPTSPPAISAIGLRDRVLLPNFTPDTTSNLWQGRLALYGFVEDPDNPGTNFIVRKPHSLTEFLKNVNQDDEQLDRDKVLDAIIFTDAGTLASTAEEFFWDAGKLLAERDIIGSARNLYTVDSTLFESLSDSLIYTTDLTTFDKTLDPSVFGIGDSDVTFTDLSVFPTIISVNPFCTAECPTDVSDDCEDLTSTTCKDCVKICLRDGIVDFMSGETGLLPITDSLGTGTTDACTSDILSNTESGIIGCGCSDPDADPPVVGSFDNCERRLGDVFHSLPKFVQSPSLFFPDTGFQLFSLAFRKRDAAIYVGANDGFLHAFDGGKFIDVISDTTLTDNEKRNPFTGEMETLPFVDEGTGEEIFAYAPATFLQDARSGIDPTSPALDLTVPESNFPDYRFGDFKTLVTDEFSEQRSFFDGSPTIIDVFLDGNADQTNGIPDSSECSSTLGIKPDGEIDACGKEWHSILVSGFRNGGAGITALDITNFDFDDKTDSDADGHPDFQQFTASNAPAYPKHMWTLFDREMGNSWSQPKVGRVRALFKDGGGSPPELKQPDRWLAFFGGGLDPVYTDPVADDDNDGTINAEEDDYRGDAFYAVDIATGEIVFKFDVNDDANFICEILSNPAVVDINADGYLDLAYVGDTCGRMWRFDISEPIESDEKVEDGGGIGGTPGFTAPNWSGKAVFCAGDETTCLVDPGFNDNLRKPALGDTIFPIYFAPSVVLDNSGKRHVIFVTGNRRSPTDESLYGKLYNFIDEFTTSFSSGGNPGPDTFKTEDDIDGDPAGDPGATIALTDSGSGVEFEASGTAEGEFIVTFPNGGVTTQNTDGSTDFEGGEKGAGSPIVFNSVLIFTTFNPDAGAVNLCTGGLGTGRIFALDFITGAPALFRIPGALSLISSKDVAGIRGGEGMPTPAQISFSEKGNVSLSIAFSGSGTSGGAQFHIWELARLPSQSQLVYWEEII